MISLSVFQQTMWKSHKQCSHDEYTASIQPYKPRVVRRIYRGWNHAVGSVKFKEISGRQNTMKMVLRPTAGGNSEKRLIWSTLKPLSLSSPFFFFSHLSTPVATFSQHTKRKAFTHTQTRKPTITNALSTPPGPRFLPLFAAWAIKSVKHFPYGLCIMWFVDGRPETMAALLNARARLCTNVGRHICNTNRARKQQLSHTHTHTHTHT